jgi:hypothetical protein
MADFDVLPEFSFRGSPCEQYARMNSFATMSPTAANRSGIHLLAETIGGAGFDGDPSSIAQLFACPPFFPF